MGSYYGRYARGGRLVAVGMFIGGAFSLYDGRDGKFHYEQRYDNLYYEGEFDEITNEEAEKFMKKIDAYWKKK